LLRGIGTCKAQTNAVLREKCTRSVIIKFATIIGLERKNWALKLSGDESMKRRKSREHVGLAA
jgi:hypothetical protein